METIELLTTDRTKARPFHSIGVASRFADKIIRGSSFTARVLTEGAITPEINCNGVPHYFASAK